MHVCIETCYRPLVHTENTESIQVIFTHTHFKCIHTYRHTPSFKAYIQTPSFKKDIHTPSFKVRLLRGNIEEPRTREHTHDLES